MKSRYIENTLLVQYSKMFRSLNEYRSTVDFNNGILTTCFVEEPISVIKFLRSPFNRFAITHFGTVFDTKNLRYTKIQNFTIIDKFNIVPVKYTTNYLKYVTLILPEYGIHTNIRIDRLLADRFFNVPIGIPVTVEYLDNDTTNTHVFNLRIETTRRNIC